MASLIRLQPRGKGCCGGNAEQRDMDDEIASIISQRTMEAIRIGKQTFTFSINTSFHEEFLCTMERSHSCSLNETSMRQNHCFDKVKVSQVFRQWEPSTVTDR